MFYPFLYFDQFYLLLILPALLISVIAQNAVNRTYKKYAKISVNSAGSAASTARSILKSHGLDNISIERIGGRLTDHYDPRAKTLRLSQAVHDSNSIAALGVAAHEVAHALQHGEGYIPLRIRDSVAPLVNIVSTLAVPLFLFGMVLSMLNLVYIGIAAFTLAVAFQLVTLPIEVNASHRALKLLESGNFVTGQEAAGSKQVLRAAAFTYVASTLMSIVVFLRFLLLAPRRN
ncbi:MAG: zinc metallopeptidase [Clostridiales bacterium]|nr:zinc metallopeptidase [Clostridiales bacterium]